MTQYVYGKNVVHQLLKEQKRIYEVIVSEGLKDRKLIKALKQRHLTIRSMPRKQMDRLLKTEHHQGIAACIDDYKTYSLEELLETIPEGKTPFLIMLDNLEDPHNLGAILRTCDAVGADGVILAKNRSVSLNPTVAKVSTGAIDTVKVAVVNNLSQTLVRLKEKGFWAVGADLEQSIDYREADFTVPLVLVVGSEGFGIRPLVRKNCDYCVRLPMVGTITSLNASVACGILLYEVFNQRDHR